MCNDPELILGYLYGELREPERRAFDSHLATCAACRGELAELRATRGHLAAWTPPEPDVGFRIVRGANAAPPARRRWPAPAWGLAAAAVLVLAAAAAIANVEVRYDANGFVVRTGWTGAAGAPSGPADAGVATAPLTSDEWRAQIATLDRRLLDLERAASQQPVDTQLASGPRMSDAEILRRVREIVGRSETRQQRQFAVQVAQVLHDVDRARQLDLRRIQQGLDQQRKQTSAEVAHTVNYILTRVSQEK